MVDRNSHVKTMINQKLVETGEKERLKEMLRQRLCESGWRDEVKKLAKDTVQDVGVNNITVDKLISSITPRSRELIPQAAKRELMAGIKRFLTEQAQLRG